MNADSVIYSVFIGIKDLIYFFTGDLGRINNMKSLAKYLNTINNVSVDFLQVNYICMSLQSFRI